MTYVISIEFSNASGVATRVVGSSPRLRGDKPAYSPFNGTGGGDFHSLAWNFIGGARKKRLVVADTSLGCHMKGRSGKGIAAGNASSMNARSASNETDVQDAECTMHDARRRRMAAQTKLPNPATFRN